MFIFFREGIVRCDINALCCVGLNIMMNVGVGMLIFSCCLLIQHSARCGGRCYTNFWWKGVLGRCISAAANVPFCVCRPILPEGFSREVKKYFHVCANIYGIRESSCPVVLSNGPICLPNRSLFPSLGADMLRPGEI